MLAPFPLEPSRPSLDSSSRSFWTRRWTRSSRVWRQQFGKCSPPSSSCEELNPPRTSSRLWTKSVPSTRSSRPMWCLLVEFSLFGPHGKRLLHRLEATVREMFTSFVKLRGAEPSEDIEPTLDQVSAIHLVITADVVPSCGVLVVRSAWQETVAPSGGNSSGNVHLLRQAARS